MMIYVDWIGLFFYDYFRPADTIDLEEDEDL